eukprot:5754181-Pyramimonas_sp.AAC.1
MSLCDRVPPLSSSTSIRRSKRGLGLSRPCADDVGSAIHQFKVSRQRYTVFWASRRVANPELKRRKCKVAPLAGPFSEPLADRCRLWIRSNLPEWAELQ